MATVDKKNLHFISIDKNIITCPLCMKHYQEPKLLACLHTACKRCLLSLYDHGGNRPKELECPNCDVTTPIDGEDGIAKLQDNYYVRYLIKQVRDQRMEDLCETCQNTAATVRCSTCAVKLCGVCADQHMQNKDMVHELSFLLEDDVQKRELSQMEHTSSQGSRASVHSMNASASQLKMEEEKELPFEFYCDTCKSKECDHCENMKNMARKNIVKKQEADQTGQNQIEPVKEEDPYPEPPSAFHTAKSGAAAVVTTKPEDHEARGPSPTALDGSNSRQPEGPAVMTSTENEEEQQNGRNIPEGELPDGTAVASNPVTPTEEDRAGAAVEQVSVGDKQLSIGSKTSLQSQHSVKSGRSSANVSLHGGLHGENPTRLEGLVIGESRPLSQTSLRSKDSEPMTPRAEPLNDEDRQALDVSQTSHHSSPRDGSITPTPDDDNGMPPERAYQQLMTDPQAMYDPRAMTMRHDGYGQLQTVPEHDMEGVEETGAYSGAPSPDLKQPQQGFYSPIVHAMTKPVQGGGMPKVSVSAPFGFTAMRTDHHQGGGGAGGYHGGEQVGAETEVEFRRPDNWPAFDERMSMSQDESQASHEDIYLTEEEAKDIVKKRSLQQQFEGMVKVQPAMFPTQNFTIGTGTGPSGPKRKPRAIRAQSGGPKDRSGGSAGTVTRGKKQEADDRRAQSASAGTTASMVRTQPSPYHEKLPRDHPTTRQPNTWAHTANADVRKGTSPRTTTHYDYPGPRSSTPTEITKLKNSKNKPNRLGFNVQRSVAPGKQAKARVIFPELSPQAAATGRKGGMNLKPMGTEYVAHSNKRASGVSQTGRNLQRPKTALITRGMNPEAFQRVKQPAADDSTSLASDESDIIHDPILRQMQYEHENIFEGDPVLRSMAKFHTSTKAEPNIPQEQQYNNYPYQDYHDTNSVSMVSDTRDDDDKETGSQVSLLSNNMDLDRKRSKMGLNIRSTGTMFDAFVPVRFSELIREDEDPILYDIEHTVQCITAMPAYEGYSLEELRYNDYGNFEEHTKGLLRKNYSLVYSVLQAGFKLDKLPENKVSPDRFPSDEDKDQGSAGATQPHIHSTWPFEVDTKTAQQEATTSCKAGSVVLGDTSINEQQHHQQLNTSQMSNKSQRSNRSQGQQKMNKKKNKNNNEVINGEAANGGPLVQMPDEQPEKEKPPSKAPKKQSPSKSSSQEGISITEVLNGDIKSQPASRASSRPNSSKPPSRPGSRIGEAPAFEPPPSPDRRGQPVKDWRPTTPNSARQSIPNSARKMEQSGFNRTPSPEDIFEAMKRSTERPFVTTGSHPNSPVPVISDRSLDGSQKQGSEVGSIKGSKQKVVFNFEPMTSKDQVDLGLAFGLPEMFGGLSIWEKWSLFQATKHYVPTLLGAAKEYWATRGRPKYTSRLRLGASRHSGDNITTNKPAQLTTVVSQPYNKERKENDVDLLLGAASTMDVKFEAPIICHRTKMADGENNQMTQINCITAMRELEAYSLEELRFGDYLNWGYVIKAESGLCTEQVLEALLLKNAHEKMC